MLDNTDLIDRYLTGDLGDDEKKELERLLFDDSDSLESKKLREEMELQKEIILSESRIRIYKIFQTDYS